MSQPPYSMNILKIQQDHLTRFPIRECRRDGLHTFIYQFSDIHATRNDVQNYAFSMTVERKSVIDRPAARTI